MGSGHAHALHVHGHSRVHAMAPEAKVLATVGFVTAVALTPIGAWWAFAGHGLLLAAALWRAELPPGFVLRRLVVVLPFVAFALFVPFIAAGEKDVLWGISYSPEGLRASGTILAKSLLGASASIVLTATTEAPRILQGLERLRVPSVLTTIAAFMLRYVEIITGQFGRMRTAMALRGHDPRWLWQARPIANAAGTVFVRSYERGERVHAAMLARGFDGSMPDLGHPHAIPADWTRTAAVVLPAALVTAAALVLS